MPAHQVGSIRATAIRRQKGITLTLVNQGGTDVYIDYNPNRLNATDVGVTPRGTKIAASGGQLQITAFGGTIWTRATADVEIEVQP